MSSPDSLPKISIVTPSFNQGEFLEETIRSVLDQGYPNLEYLILDGGSTDLSSLIIDRYRDRLSFVRIGPDAGQYHAIQEGINRSTGDLVAWLNSDDIYHPMALWRMATAAAQFPGSQWFCGLPTMWNAYGDLQYVNKAPPEWTYEYLMSLVNRSEPHYLQQESTFFRRTIWDQAGATFDLSLRLAADYELWLRFSRIQQVKQLDSLIGGFRVHTQQRSSLQRTTYMDDVRMAVATHQKAPELPAEPLAEPTPTPDPVPARSPGYLSRLHDRFVLATSIAPHRQYAQYKAVRSWLDAGFRVLSFNEPQEVQLLRSNFPEVEFVPVARTARAVVGKPLVYIADVLEHFAASDVELCGIINSDISFTNTLGIRDALAGHMATHDLIVSSRIEVTQPQRQIADHHSATGRANVRFGSVYLWGFDLFVLNRASASRIAVEMGSDSPFAFGVPWWDYIVPSLAMKIGLRTGILNPPPISHPSHSANYQWRLWQMFGHYYLHVLGIDEAPDLQAFVPKHQDAYLSRICLQFIQFFARGSTQIDLGALVEPHGELSARLGFGGLPDATLSNDAVMQIAVGKTFKSAPFVNLAGFLRDAFELDAVRVQAAALLKENGLAHGS